MKNYNSVYFSILDYDKVDAALIELLCAATLEYSDFLIISNSPTILTDTVQHIESAIKVRPQALLVSTDTLLATAEHFLKHFYQAKHPETRFVKFDPDTGLTSESIQFCPENIYFDSNTSTYNYANTSNFHPIVKHTIEIACAEKNELNRHITQLLTGCSFLPDSFLESKSIGTDFDGLQLHELKAFSDILTALKPNFRILDVEIDGLLQFCNTLMTVRPNNSADLSNSYPTAALQNGFPCVYKVISIFHYLAYELSLRRQLYNKAFMHIFRCYECYASGALFLRNATIGIYTTKKGTFPDSYMLGPERVLGFSSIYRGIGANFNLSQNPDYTLCQLYIDLRNKFHYTHGDLKPSKNLIHKFARAVIKQILRIEKSEGQLNFRWIKVYRQTARMFLNHDHNDLAESIVRHLGMPPHALFTEM
ncbi:hypothetical protein [Pseudomonas fluorescens]|jgi:hypothetical protein|uniref:hypothetical protein n=1 Tax=Pseudomonas fluorescens TaxID=294 RepID=UPI0013987C8F|nr:hypothetical protein [Pseudomonas fluorescens]QIA03538.1 hypothetical protein GZH78_15785 [Pseudomonas fluorescens]